MLRVEKEGQVRVRRWPTERILLILNALASAGLWFLFFRSVQSIAYIVMSSTILLLMNIASVAAIRGSAVRLSEEQFPDLHARVDDDRRVARIASTAVEAHLGTRT
jgi:hypothetical protein